MITFAVALFLGFVAGYLVGARKVGGAYKALRQWIASRNSR
jgi:hypothetical protein